MQQILSEHSIGYSIENKDDNSRKGLCHYKHVKKAVTEFLSLLHLQFFVESRNYRLNRNGNLANFFSYVCNSKKIKELFAPTLNGTTARVRCVSSMIVVVNAKWLSWLRRRRT